MMTASVAVTFKPGLGRELVMVAPLLSALCKRGASISIFTFHPFLYNPARLLVNDLSSHTLSLEAYEPVSLGACFFAPARARGPERSLKLEREARMKGWNLFDEDLECVGEVDNLYLRARRLPGLLRLDKSSDCPSIVAERAKDRTGVILVNLFGGSDRRKGFPCIRVARRFISMVAEAFPHRDFIISRVEYHPEFPRKVLFPRNVHLRSFSSHDRELIELSGRADGILTVEGGMVHIGTSLRVPTFLLTTPEWYREVAFILPPELNGVCFCCLSAPDSSVVSSQVCKWLKEL